MFHRIGFTLFAPLTVMAAFAQGAPANQGPQQSVTGIIQSFDGKVAVIKNDSGMDVPVNVPANAMVNLYSKRKLSDIKPGDFIASGGTKDKDGKIRANEIRIFTGARGEGQFPMNQPNQVMTNATVTEIGTGATVKQVTDAAGTPVIKLTFHGSGAPGSPNCSGRASEAPSGAGSGCVGETQFEVPANVPIYAVLPGNPSMLKPGAKVQMNVAVSPDGNGSATRVTVYEN
jgi:hypothetical protein